MMKKRFIHAAMLALALPGAAMAGDAGTLYIPLTSNGMGIGYAKSVSDSWAVRGQYTAFKTSYSGDVSDLGSSARLNIDLNLSTTQVLGDWYPGDGGFRLTGGVVFNDNKITIAGTGATVGTATNQTVNAEIKMSKNPGAYLGIGYATRPKNAKGFGFVFDLGVMGQDPEVTLTASSASASDIATQKAKIQDAVNNLKAMPVLGIGVSYSF